MAKKIKREKTVPSTVAIGIGNFNPMPSVIKPDFEHDMIGSLCKEAQPKDVEKRSLVGRIKN